MKQHRPTELECQRVIVAAAKRGGWLVHAERPAMRQSGKWSTPIQGDVGFPDLVLAHPERGLLFVELKRLPNKITEGQTRWLTLLQQDSDVCRSEVWYVPDSLDYRVAWLIGEPAAVAS